VRLPLTFQWVVPGRSAGCRGQNGLVKVRGIKYHRRWFAGLLPVPAGERAVLAGRSAGGGLLLRPESKSPFAPRRRLCLGTSARWNAARAGASRRDSLPRFRV